MIKRIYIANYIKKLIMIIKKITKINVVIIMKLKIIF